MTRDLIFAEFVKATYPALLAFLLRRVGDRAAAEDLAQAAYEAVYRHATFDPRRPDAFGFLRRRAGWLVADSRRAPRRPQPLPADLPDQRPDRAERVQDVRERVRAAVARLPAPYRVIVARHLEGMGHAQIAADLKMRIRTVYSRFHRAKSLLRALLGERGADSSLRRTIRRA